MFDLYTYRPTDMRDIFYNNKLFDVHQKCTQSIIYKLSIARNLSIKKNKLPIGRVASILRYNIIYAIMHSKELQLCKIYIY